jgi:flagellar biosynthesis/type III secretory pathway M-ring protein FliF/YscJ
MMASSYGWAALAAFILAIAIAVAVWIKRGQKQAADLREAQGEAAANKAVADANKAAVDAGRVDPGPVPGASVRDRPDKPVSGF